MPAKHGPNCQDRQRRDGREQPSRHYRRELGRDLRVGAKRQLNEQPQRAGFLFMSERADRHERKQQRDRHVEGTECGDQDAVQRRQPAWVGDCTVAALASP